jgi:hypothetical protein
VNKFRALTSPAFCQPGCFEDRESFLFPEKLRDQKRIRIRITATFPLRRKLDTTSPIGRNRNRPPFRNMGFRFLSVSFPDDQLHPVKDMAVNFSLKWKAL